VVTFLIEPHQDIVRLTVTHENLPNQEMLNGGFARLVRVLANLNSVDIRWRPMSPRRQGRWIDP
jgi:hypothetical protein